MRRVRPPLSRTEKGHPRITTLPHSPAITLRPARADELDTYFALTLLVDLHLAADHLHALKGTIGQALEDERGPFSHGFNHFLFAVTPTAPPPAPSTPAGPDGCWSGRSPPTSGALSSSGSPTSTPSLSTPTTAVKASRPALARVETDFRNAGYRALTLRHEPDGKRFFTSPGYTSLPRLAMHLPSFGLFTHYDWG
ncbi:hypothetical protein ACWELO_34425 [Streptomyces sp. NPDC004596]